MRSLWKGAISFGLVHIPVKLYTATESRDVRFHMLHRYCHTPVRCGPDLTGRPWWARQELLAGFVQACGRILLGLAPEGITLERAVPEAFTIATVPARLAAIGDPFAPVLTDKQPLDETLRRLGLDA